MKIKALFILAFAVVTAAIIKSKTNTVNKSGAKKSRTVAAVKWPGVMKKTDAKNLLLASEKKSNNGSALGSSTSSNSPSAAPNKKPAVRGLASVAGAPSIARPTAFTQRAYSGASGRNRPMAYSGSNYYYGANGPQNLGAQGLASRQASYSNGIDVSAQELASFTRTPDLSININLDPELAESFEDQVRKFREQNQLTSQDLQELEVITNTFISMSNSVQRGQVPMQQVNAEAIKVTRSFTNLKRRVEARAQ